MADEETPQPEPQETPSDQAKEALDSFTSMVGGDSSRGEAWVAVAGLAIVILWLIFDVFIDDYGVDNTIAVLGAIAVIVPRLNANWFVGIRRAAVMKAIGYVIALFGLVELIFDLRFNVYSDGGTVIAALLHYAAFVLAFFGARAIELGGDE